MATTLSPPVSLTPNFFDCLVAVADGGCWLDKLTGDVVTMLIRDAITPDYDGSMTADFVRQYSRRQPVTRLDLAFQTLNRVSKV
jgi:hypothetical protein